jgi:hypothetical protein
VCEKENKLLYSSIGETTCVVRLLAAVANFKTNKFPSSFCGSS